MIVDREPTTANLETVDVAAHNGQSVKITFFMLAYTVVVIYINIHSNEREPCS
jgi:hypothetical protein